MNNQTPSLLSALVSESFALKHLPGGSLLGFAIEQLFHRRLEAAREILLEELRKGDLTLSENDIEEGAAIMERYIRAASEGTARINLRLIAKVIAGQAHLGVLRASEFLRYTAMLDSLNYEEILLIGNLYKHWTSEGAGKVTADSRAHYADIASQQELIPSVFATVDEWFAIAGATTRTGLIYAASAVGVMVYYPTTLMDRMNELAPFEAALEDEANKTSS